MMTVNDLIKKLRIIRKDKQKIIICISCNFINLYIYILFFAFTKNKLYSNYIAVPYFIYSLIFKL